MTCRVSACSSKSRTHSTLSQPAAPKPRHPITERDSDVNPRTAKDGQGTSCLRCQGAARPLAQGAAVGSPSPHFPSPLPPASPPRSPRLLTRPHPPPRARSLHPPHFPSRAHTTATQADRSLSLSRPSLAEQHVLPVDTLAQRTPALASAARLSLAYPSHPSDSAFALTPLVSLSSPGASCLGTANTASGACS